MKIIKPLIGGHDGSSFRELLDLWQEHGLCTVESGPVVRSFGYSNDPDSPEAKCWIEKQGGILLYDFPRLNRLRHDYELCLFSNSFKEGVRNKKWIFWPRWSRIFNEKIRDLRIASKKFKCGFIGSPTNHKRNSIAEYWSKGCDVFHLGNAIDHSDYLDYCSKFKFGLCLPGVGPKCLRDVEYMGMGVIPVVVDRSAMDLYYEPPKENEHYIFVNDLSELSDKLDDLLCNETKIKYMSDSCVNWFERNCSIFGSFNTTQRIINE